MLAVSLGIMKWVDTMHLLRHPVQVLQYLI